MKISSMKKALAINLKEEMLRLNKQGRIDGNILKPKNKKEADSQQPTKAMEKAFEKVARKVLLSQGMSN